MATCVLGFTDAAMPTGIFGCPNPQEMCAVAGGYAYVVDTLAPERSMHVAMKPVVQVLPMVEQGLLLFVGFHGMLAWGREGLAWETARLSWEGVRVVGVEGGQLMGFGWDLMSDKEREFRVDMRTGRHTGGGYL